MYFLKAKRKNGKEYLIRVFENRREAYNAMLAVKNSFIKPSKEVIRNGGSVQTY
jgi:hypothetical protein